MRCAGCSCPIEQGEFFMEYAPKGYWPESFCHPSCLEDWLEAGCPSQRPIGTKHFPAPPERQGIWEKLGAKMAQLLWGDV